MDASSRVDVLPQCASETDEGRRPWYRSEGGIWVRSNKFSYITASTQEHLWSDSEVSAHGSGTNSVIWRARTVAEGWTLLFTEREIVPESIKTTSTGFGPCQWFRPVYTVLYTCNRGPPASSNGSLATPLGQYDVVVIGGGPDGYVAAIEAAQLGL
ncbi:hypothetical protein H4582DRAFT_2131016 [Lactarius indigo]|nr:hypothetical protein H4582DRAFT_2131016 [Lactarius indigo]